MPNDVDLSVESNWGGLRPSGRRGTLACRARLAWYVERRKLVKVPASLVEINDRGAWLLVANAVENPSCVWFGIMSLPHEWVKSEIHAVERVNSQWQYQIFFHEPCSPGIIERAAEGLELPTARFSVRALTEGW